MLVLPKYLATRGLGEWTGVCVCFTTPLRRYTLTPYFISKIAHPQGYDHYSALSHVADM